MPTALPAIRLYATREPSAVLLTDRVHAVDQDRRPRGRGLSATKSATCDRAQYSQDSCGFVDEAEESPSPANPPRVARTRVLERAGIANRDTNLVAGGSAQGLPAVPRGGPRASRGGPLAGGGPQGGGG